ncbi:MAG: helix-turn-helix domain-containing protein [Candidatus Leucobacter sulfamidivorax]|nr:helix-turn-helix domain-containing protein [Candidatus Leucobacter sulfamidivorax]
MPSTVDLRDAALPPSIDGGSTTSIDDFTEMVSRIYSPVRITADDPAHFRGGIRSRVLGEVYVNEVRSSQHEIARDDAEVRLFTKDHRFLKVSVLMSGHANSVQGTSSTDFEPGQMIIHDSARPYTMYLDDDFHMVFLLIPRDRFDLPDAATNDLIGQRIEDGAGVSGTVLPFFSTLARNIADLNGPSAVRLMSNTVDLVETMMFSLVGQTLSEPHRTRRRELLMQIQAFIDCHLDDPELDPQQIAAANFISTRYLHRLFSDEDLTVAGYMRQARLVRCRRDLSDPLLAHLPVSTIASRWGFLNSSHFSRLFRQVVGISPTEYRFNAMVSAA